MSLIIGHNIVLWLSSLQVAQNVQCWSPPLITKIHCSGLQRMAERLGDLHKGILWMPRDLAVDKKEKVNV